MDLLRSIDELPQTKKITIDKFKSIGINTLYELLCYVPLRYEVYGPVVHIEHIKNSITSSDYVTVFGKVKNVSVRYIRKNFTVLQVVIQDESGSLELVWYNQKYLHTIMKIGIVIQVSGTVKKGLNGVIQLLVSSYDIIRPGLAPIHTTEIVPFYSEKGGISNRTIREKIHSVLRLVNNDEVKIDDIFTKKLCNTFEIPTMDYVLKNVHTPSTIEDAHTLQERLQLNELVLLQLQSHMVKKLWEKETLTHPFLVKKYTKNVQNLIKTLPYELTNSQKKVLQDIQIDLEKKTAMNRFVQGDVGSGKTIIALISSYIAYKNGFTTLIMAPTEILAQQHFSVFKKILDDNINIYLKTGSKTLAKENIKYPCIMIGTHALIQNDIEYKQIGLIIIDEQHKFGVKQRGVLKDKGIHPHVLTMTATPIPRTVLLTIHGELSVSVLTDKPHNRLPIKTFYVPKKKREDSYTWLRNEIMSKGEQIYWVCPLVEESEHESMQDIKAVTKEYESLVKIFPDKNIALLHGKIKPKEKDIIMKDFKDKKYDILVSTSVIEVGIDVASATVIVIESCERYGLSQLHQLRGRVGRGNLQSYCLLFSENSKVQDNERIHFFVSHDNGMELSEFDFKTRGPGDIFGVNQSGFGTLLPETLSNSVLIALSQKIVDYIINIENEILDSPILKKRLIQNIEFIARD